jgi:hypothetical protein
MDLNTPDQSMERQYQIHNTAVAAEQLTSRHRSVKKAFWVALFNSILDFDSLLNVQQQNCPILYLDYRAFLIWVFSDERAG